MSSKFSLHALLSSLSAPVPGLADDEQIGEIVINLTGTPAEIRESIITQIDGILGAGLVEHTKSCSHCAEARQEVIDSMYADAEAKAKANAMANDRIRRVEQQATNAALDQVSAETGTDEAKTHVGGNKDRTYAAAYGANEAKAHVAGYAAVIQREGKPKVLHFTMASTETDALVKLNHAAATLSITFNDYEIKPLYL